jgi:perosamine synthetase
MKTIQPFEQLEKDLQQYYGGSKADRTKVVVCTNGTSALHLALEVLNFPAGRKIWVPNFTMIAVARAVTLAGHTPEFIDVDPETMNIDVDLIESMLKQGSRPLAIIAVNTYGRVFNQRLIELAKQYGFWIIEDAAEANNLKPTGLIGFDFSKIITATSFYQNKIIHGEEGGAVITTNPYLYLHLKQLRCLGFGEIKDYMHSPRGHNYRLSNANASLIGQSLQNVILETQARDDSFDLLNETCPPNLHNQDSRLANWVYDFRVRGLGRKKLLQLVQQINELGVGLVARPSFYPLSRQPEYSSYPSHRGEVADKLSEEVLYVEHIHKLLEELGEVKCEEAVAKLWKTVGYYL